MTTTTVRPNATTTNSGVNTSGAVAAHTVLSDTSNATFAQGSRNNAFLLLENGTVTLGANERLRQARMGLVYAHDGVDIGHIERVNYRFRDGVSGAFGIESGASTYSSTFPAASAPLYGPWNTRAPDNGVWTQAKINALQARLTWVASVNNQFLKVSEVYVQFETNNQPVVSGVTVSGFAESTRPSVVFDYVDQEDDLQVEYVARAFSAAQYGATGFDPETSPNTWDSGVVQSSAEAFTVGADLLNGVTYKIYVKAAQSWDGPEGSRWYSAWAASAAFTIAVSPPPKPTITVTQELGLPHYRNVINVSLAGLNVLDSDSAGFEGGVGQWVNDSNTTVAVSATNPKSGSQALQLTAVAGGDMVVRSGSFATSKRVRPNSAIGATGSFRAATTGRTVNVGVRIFDVTGASLGDFYGSNQTDTNAGYTTATYTGTTPATAYSYIELAKVTAAGAGEVHRLDEAGLNFGAVTAWTPGGYAQNGSVQLQSSQRISPTINRNPARNFLHPQTYSAGALTSNTDSFYPRQANDSVVFRLLDVAPPEAPTNTTAGMIEWIIRVGAFSYLDIGAVNGVATDGMNPYSFAAVPGLSYTASGWFKGSAGNPIRFAIQFTDEFNTTVGSATLSTTTVLTTSFQRIDVTATCPAGATFGVLIVEDTNGVASWSVFMTQLRVRLSTSVDQNWPGQMFSWLWDDVRGGTVALPQDGRDFVTILDHEAPPDRPILYSARIAALTSSGADIASLRSSYVQVYMTPPSVGVMKDTSQPENAFRMLARTRGEEVTLDEDTTELHAAQRDADPMFGRDWISGDKGTVTLDITSELELYRLEQLLPTSRTVLLQWKIGGQIYAHITSSSITRIREFPTDSTCLDTLAIARFTYSEQARPLP